MNININTPHTNDADLTIEEHSEYQQYIIKNNIHLTKENKELRQYIITLKNDNSNNENEMDKYDERMRYMRGLLHNLYTLKEMSVTTCKEWEKFSNNYNKLFKKCIMIEKYVNNIFHTYLIYILLYLILDHMYSKTFNLFFIFILFKIFS